ncbi:hypothetical protein BS78_01G513000 [Paspalum vaginatum]|nr:hypothetical protein BS78_01G513000 [Paspalum vaginatum]
MSASPEFYRPPAPPAFSPLPLPVVPAADDDSCCRTPTGSGITYLRREPTTCPPAPRKPKPSASCKKRLFQFHHQAAAAAADNNNTHVVPVISLRLDELHRIFRPLDQEARADTDEQHADDKRRRRSIHPIAARPATTHGARPATKHDLT